MRNGRNRVAQHRVVNIERVADKFAQTLIDAAVIAALTDEAGQPAGMPGRDRYLSPEIERAVALVKSGAVRDAAARAAGSLD